MINKPDYQGAIRVFQNDSVVFEKTDIPNELTLRFYAASYTSLPRDGSTIIQLGVSGDDWLQKLSLSD